MMLNKKKLSFIAKLTQVSTVEMQLNPTKKTRQNVSKHFLKKNTKKFHFKTYLRAKISNRNRREPTKKNPSPGLSTYKKVQNPGNIIILSRSQICIYVL